MTNFEFNFVMKLLQTFAEDVDVDEQPEECCKVAEFVERSDVEKCKAVLSQKQCRLTPTAHDRRSPPRGCDECER